jgi:hypothetical protein
VQKKTIDACFHNHNLAASTWSHAGHVKKNEYATPKQKLKNVATKKSNSQLLPSCANS